MDRQNAPGFDSIHSASVRSRAFYVVGNGPSLTEPVLRTLPEGRWLGMNSAFRFWKLINRFPKYYACLDPVVAKSQAEGIVSLFKQSPIELFFLHDAILELQPELASDGRLILLSRFLAKKDWIVPVSEIGAYKQTTGALAARFVIEQGEREVVLLGVDCNYVEVIDEAEQLPENELVIGKNVATNPNYFFSGYQQVGDKYQIPNPPIHSGNLHLQSLACLHSDILASWKGIEVYVGSEESLLNKHGIFRFRDYWASMGLRKLQCVAVPLTARELDTFLDNLKHWLDPRLKPSLFFLRKGTVLHLFFPGAEDRSIIERIRQAVDEYREIYSYFESVKVTFFGFPESVDYYIRKLAPNEFRFCTKSGPNLMFLSVLAHCGQYEYVMQMESDCLPVKAGWLDAADNLIASSGEKPWIIGPAYFGPTSLDTSYRAHINGNAIYNTGNPQFQAFIQNGFTPLLKHLIRNGVNDLAYDTTLSLAFSNLQLLEAEMKDSLLRALPRIRHTNLILNAGGRMENEDSHVVDVPRLLKANPEAFFVHGRKATEALKTQVTKLGLYFNTTPDSLTNELAAGHFWASCPGYTKLNLLGYGRGIVAGTPKERVSRVVLHYLRLDSLLTPLCSFSVTGTLTGTVDLISRVEVLFQNSKFQSHRLEAGGRASIALSPEGKLAITVENPPLLDDIIRIALLFEIRTREDQPTVSLQFDQFTLKERRKTGAEPVKLQIEPSASAVNALVADWWGFVESGPGARRG